MSLLKNLFGNYLGGALENRFNKKKDSKPVTYAQTIKYSLEFKNKITDKRFESQKCYLELNKEKQPNKCSLCKKIMEMNRYYSRSDIETMSMRLGYSVWDNPGGVVDNNGNKICACYWNQEFVIQKK